MHRAAIKFFSSPDNSAVRNQWKDAKSFYNSYTKRNQDPDKKNDARLKKQQEELSPFELPASIQL